MVETRRQQIEDTASELFRERGYAATSVRDIARAVSLQGGSLYAHVASKEDVLWAIVVRAAGAFEAAAAATTSDAAGPAADRIRQLCRAHIRVLAADLGNASVFLTEWRFLGEARRDQVREMRDHYEGHFRELIAQGAASGEFRSVDVALTSTALLSTLNGVAIWYRPDGRLSPDEIADRYADLFAKALENR